MRHALFHFIGYNQATLKIVLYFVNFNNKSTNA